MSDDSRTRYQVYMDATKRELKVLLAARKTERQAFKTVMESYAASVTSCRTVLRGDDGIEVMEKASAASERAAIARKAVWEATKEITRAMRERLTSMAVYGNNLVEGD